MAAVATVAAVAAVAAVVAAVVAVAAVTTANRKASAAERTAPLLLPPAPMLDRAGELIDPHEQYCRILAVCRSLNQKR